MQQSPMPITTASTPDTSEDALYQRILRAVAAQIADGSLKEGARLMESRIATQYGVSRQPARQALLQLQSLGLITPAPANGRGYVIAQGAAQKAVPIAADAPVSMETTTGWQRIYSDVEDTLTRHIPFGSWRVVEATLGQHYGVSRTVARDVLARLNASGLVENQGKGWIAPQLTETRLRDLYAMRALLEPAALQEVGQTAPAEMVDRMIKDLKTAMQTPPDHAGLDQLEADLHFELLSRCQNKLLRKAMRESQSLILAHRFFYKHTADLFPTEPFLQDHLDILESLRRGQIDKAQDILRQHLLTSCDRALLRLGQLHQSAPDPISPYLDRIAP